MGCDDVRWDGMGWDGSMAGTRLSRPLLDDHLLGQASGAYARGALYAAPTKTAHRAGRRH